MIHCSRILLLGCAVVLVQFSSVATASGADVAARQIRLVLRYDDPSATTDTETEIKLIEALRQHGMVCTFGIVPFACAGFPRDIQPQEELPLPPEKAKLFAAAAREGLLELAQHGYSHQANGPPSPHFSEFAGLDHPEQMRKVQRGKAFLEAELGMDVKIFVPPWNTYDANTIRAVESSGFTYFSADMHGPADSTSSMTFLPYTSSLTTIKEVIACARAAPDPEPVVVMLFHGYDFLEVDASRGVLTFDQFLATLQWFSQQPDVRIVRMDELSELARGRYAANQHLLTTPRYLPGVLRGPVYPLVLLSPEGIRNARRQQRPALRLVAFYGALALFVAIASFLATGVVLAKMPPIAAQLLFLSGPVVLACSLVWAFPDGHFGGRLRMIMAVTGAAAYCVGTWGTVLGRRHGPGKAKPQPSINSASPTEPTA